MWDRESEYEVKRTERLWNDSPHIMVPFQAWPLYVSSHLAHVVTLACEGQVFPNTLPYCWHKNHLEIKIQILVLKTESPWMAFKIYLYSRPLGD